MGQRWVGLLKEPGQCQDYCHGQHHKGIARRLTATWHFRGLFFSESSANPASESVYHGFHHDVTCKYGTTMSRRNLSWCPIIKMYISSRYHHDESLWHTITISHSDIMPWYIIPINYDRIVMMSHRGRSSQYMLARCYHHILIMYHEIMEPW